MSGVLQIFKAAYSSLGTLLSLYGGWGLLTINLLDSSFVPFPVVNDLLLIHLASHHPSRLAVYALQATIGSILGSYIIYGIGRGGQALLSRKAQPHAVDNARRWLQRNDFVAILVASLVPPPAPYKLFLLTAGVLRVNAARFGAALFVGRGLRFSAEALLGARYGVQAEAYLKANAAWTSIVAAGVIVLFVWLYRRFTRRPLGREVEKTASDLVDPR